MPDIVSPQNSSRKKFTRRKSFEIYKQVIELRKREFSYSEIRKQTGVAKSTINNWLTYSGLILSKEHLEIQAKKKAENHEIATAASKVTRARRKEARVQLFIQSIKKYFSDPFFVGGIMLYEAEGSKGPSNGFSNSDFRLIKVFMNFLVKYILLDRDKNMTFRLYIHDTRKSDLAKITNFWSKKLSINPGNIKLSWKHNIVVKRRINPDYVGQFEVRVRGFSNLTGKLLAVSDIILKKYQRY